MTRAFFPHFSLSLYCNPYFGCLPPRINPSPSACEAEAIVMSYQDDTIGFSSSALNHQTDFSVFLVFFTHLQFLWIHFSLLYLHHTWTAHPIFPIFFIKASIFISLNKCGIMSCVQGPIFQCSKPSTK